MTSFPGPRKPDHFLGVTLTRKTRELVERVSKEEGDEIAMAVLKLCQHLAAWRSTAPVTERKRESTGVTYAPHMRPFVEQRAHDRPQARSAMVR